ncbi:uncharacterized protein LOC129570684 [Sitodiplosis mosellana]|uniref:uncharacterized protein LOC129570684 n=1 Tax=Sitodiplosis mosellana TaxID=263140 RepID=UPI002444F46D|nr:uncharacterized protein LOC129570684 [Sitodiplosis mosellana]
MPRTNEYGQTIGDAVPGWTIRAEPQKVTLIGRTCRLEPLEAKHTNDLYASYSQSNDGRDFTYLAIEAFKNIEELRNYVEKTVKEPGRFSFAIIHASGKAVGMISLLRADRVNGSVEVGRVVFSPLLKQSIASTEAQYLLMAYVFDGLGYRRYEWKCDTFHAQSRRAAERLGFTFEGIFRKVIVVKGRNRDSAWFSIIDSDWPKIKEAFQKWLAPENFDAEGRQIKRLQNIQKNIENIVFT